MKLETFQFGEIEFDDTKVINFQDGVIGFENLKKYILLKPEDDLFLWLSSIDEPEIIFPLFPIEALYDNYPAKEGHGTYGIVCLNKEPEKITINLVSPVYIDQQNKVGCQIILEDDKYIINYKLFKQD
jgi:flagellar assembly factor FliW